MKIEAANFAVHINEIRSGGQTGVDRAALDMALKLGLKTGGYVPRGRMAQDGRISDKYLNLRETASSDPRERTRLNVASTDGTLIISNGELSGGSLYTQQCAFESGKPLLHIDLERQEFIKAAKETAEWLTRNSIRVLNVAGPRAFEDPKIYSCASEFLQLLLDGQK